MIDDIGRTAVDDLRRSVTEDLFPDDMLRRLHETRRRRNLAGVGAAGLVTVILVAATSLARFGRDTVSAPPAGRGTTTDRRVSEVRLPPEVCSGPAHQLPRRPAGAGRTCRSPWRWTCLETFVGPCC